MKSILQSLRYLLIIMSFVFLIGYLIWPENHDAILFSIGCIWFNNMLYALSVFRRRIIFFFFNFTFFVFLLVRPFIDFLKKADWFLEPVIHYSQEADVNTSMIILLVALYSLWLGAILGNQYLLRKHRIIEQKEHRTKESFNLSLRWVSALLFCVALVSVFLLGTEKIVFIQTHSYADYYISFSSKLPYYVYIISTFLDFSLFIYLATFPPKKQTFLFLSLYVISAFPDLIAGERNPVVLNTLFSLIYYILRDFYGSKDKWMGKLEKAGLILCMPIGMAFLGLYNYIREGVTNIKFGIPDMILDLFYKQGVTFPWFCSGIGILDKLPNRGSTNYTFGGFIDYFRYGSIGQLVSGTAGLGAGNNILKATQGNSMAHHLSYIIMGNEYLEGHGCGSSFLLEVFADGGYLGIVLFCLVLGFLLIYMTEMARKGIVWFILVLAAIQGVLYMPRAEAMGGLQFLLRMPFWCTMVFCFIGAALLDRRCGKNRNKSINSFKSGGSKYVEKAY